MGLDIGSASSPYIYYYGVEIQKLRAKDSEINSYSLCLGNVSKDFSVGNMNKNGLFENINDFLVDYDSIDVDGILDIHNYCYLQYDLLRRVPYLVLLYAQSQYCTLLQKNNNI